MGEQEHYPENSLILTLPARAENVAVVRHALAGVAESLGMADSKVADLKTVVTEACMNVVVHAYQDEELGLLEVTAQPDEDALEVVVRDFGSGIRPQLDLDGESLRLGLPLIAALSDRFEIRGGAGVGTEIRMAVNRSAEAPEPVGGPPPGGEVPKGTVISLPGGDVVAPVVARVLAVIAARSNLPVDQLSDTMLLGDALAAQAPEGFRGQALRMVIEDGDATIDVKLGPLVNGGSREIRRSLELPEIGGSLEKLAEEVTVEKGDDGEYLTLRVATTRPGGSPG